MKTYIIVDLDGTVADCGERLHHILEKPKDYNSFYGECANDKPILDMIYLVRQLYKTHDIVFITGRSEVCRNETIEWIRYNIGINSPELFMDSAKNHKPDFIGKLERAKELGLTPHNVLFVLEDRSRVVKAWRDAGFRCLQVCEGDY